MARFKVFYRTADETLNSDIVTAKDTAEVWRIFDGQKVEEIKRIDDHGEARRHYAETMATRASDYPF
jgi:hypothetical protein